VKKLLTEEERILAKKNYQRKWRENNSQKIKIYLKEWNLNNKEKVLNWRRNNKDKIKEYKKTDYKNNYERIKKYNDKWRKKNPEKVAALKKKYRSSERGKANKILYEKSTAGLNVIKKYMQSKGNVKAAERQKKKSYKIKANLLRQTRRKVDPNFRIRDNLSSQIRKLLKMEGLRKDETTTMKLLGCSIPFLKKHLESQFKPEMNWNNHSLKGWHVDHIRPCASFNLSDPDQLKICFNYKNLQPMWSKENMSKGSLYNGKRYFKPKKTT